MPAVVKRRGGGVSARTKLVDEDDERGLVFDDDGASHAAEHEETFVSLLWEGGSVSRAGIAVYHRGESTAQAPARDVLNLPPQTCF